MAQIALAWSANKVTAPIVGTTKLDNLKDMIGRDKNPSANGDADRTPVEALKIELTDEDIAYLEEPYKPNHIIGHF